MVKKNVGSGPCARTPLDFHDGTSKVGAHVGDKATSGLVGDFAFFILKYICAGAQKWTRSQSFGRKVPLPLRINPVARDRTFPQGAPPSRRPAPSGIDHAQFAVFRGRNGDVDRLGLEKLRDLRRANRGGWSHNSRYLKMKKPCGRSGIFRPLNELVDRNFS